MALKRQCGSGDHDAISQLPDALLCNILSYFPTNECVRTSILSKRWLHVWTKMPSIFIDDSVLSLQKPVVLTDHSVHTSFLRFMSCVFDLYKEAPIRKFTLECSKFDLFTVNSWILSAVKHKIRKLNLCLTVNEPFRMNCVLFAYKELRALKLGKKFVLQVPDTFSCPSLKKLHLDEVEFDDDSICKFLSGCPVLEYLNIEMCSSKHWDTLVVSAPALKRLYINTFGKPIDEDSDDIHDCEYKFVLESPNLKLLQYFGYIALKGFSFGNLDSLFEALIDVGAESIHESHKTEFQHRALEIAQGISTAKVIHLHDFTLELFSFMDVGDLPIFHDVIELRLGVSEYCSGPLFTQLLHNSPNLELLILDTEYASKGDANSFKWERPDRVPECISEHLLYLNIWGFQEQKTSVVSEFMKYVEQNAKVLEECFSRPHEYE